MLIISGNVANEAVPVVATSVRRAAVAGFVPGAVRSFNVGGPLASSTVAAASSNDKDVGVTRHWRRDASRVGVAAPGRGFGACRGSLSHSLSETRHAAARVSIAPGEGFPEPGDSLGGVVPDARS